MIVMVIQSKVILCVLKKEIRTVMKYLRQTERLKKV